MPRLRRRWLNLDRTKKDLMLNGAETKHQWNCAPDRCVVARMFRWRSYRTPLEMFFTTKDMRETDFLVNQGLTKESSQFRHPKCWLFHAKTGNQEKMISTCMLARCPPAPGHEPRDAPESEQPKGRGPLRNCLSTQRGGGSPRHGSPTWTSCVSITYMSIIRAPWSRAVAKLAEPNPLNALSS